MKRVVWIGLAVTIASLGCLNDEESDAVATFRAYRTELSQQVQLFIAAALRGDSLTLQRLGTDSAIADVHLALEYDSLRVRHALEGMVTEFFETGVCEARLLTAYESRGEIWNSLIDFVGEGRRWKISRLRLSMIMD